MLGLLAKGLWFGGIFIILNIFLSFFIPEKLSGLAFSDSGLLFFFILALAEMVFTFGGK